MMTPQNHRPSAGFPPTRQHCKLPIANCKLQIERPRTVDAVPLSRCFNLQLAICNWQFAMAFVPLALVPSRALLGWSVGPIWRQVSDAVCSAVMSDVRMTQFACLAVVLGLFLLWWRK